MEYCLAEPNINLFILGDIENLGFDNDFQEVWFQTSKDRITGIVLRYHDNLILYSKDLDMGFQEVKSLLESHKVRVISGKGMVMDRFHPLVADRFSKREMIFCELADPSKLVEDAGEVIVAEEADVMDIAEVYGQISEFAGLYAPEVETRRKQIANRIKSREGIHMFIKSLSEN